MLQIIRQRSVAVKTNDYTITQQMAPLVDAYIYPADGALIPEPDVIAAICIVSVIWGNGLSFAVIPTNGYVL